MARGFFLDAEDLILTNVYVNNLNISNSLSYAVKILSRDGKTLSASTMANVNVYGYGLAVPPYHDATPDQSYYCDGIFGVWAGNGAIGSLDVRGLAVNGSAVTNVPVTGTNIANQAVGFTFNFVTLPTPPPSQKITAVTVSSNTSVTLSYATTAGNTYHVEVTTNLAPANWTTVPGSTTNAPGGVVTFNVSNPGGGGQRFYRTVSP